MDRQLIALLLRFPPRVRPQVGSYEPHVEKVLKKIREVLPVIREQQREAQGLVNRLLADHLADDRVKAIRRSRKLQTWAVAQELCRRSRDTVFHDPKTAVKLGTLASEVANHVSSQVPGLGDLRALCFATTGNAYRVLCWNEQANRHFDLAYQHLGKEGAGDRYAQAEVFNLHASLLKDQQHYIEALSVLTQAVRLFRSEGDERRLAKCLIKRGCINREAEDLPTAIQAYMDALKMLDEHQEPWLTFVAAHNLAVVYCDRGEFKAARSALRTLSEETIAEALGTRNGSNQLQLLWTKARVAAGLGRRAQAIRMLADVEQGFVALPDPVNAALAALDNAKLYHKARSYGRVEEILKRAHAVLLEHRFPAQIKETLAMLVEASREKRLVRQGIEQAITRLKKHRARRPC